MYQNLIHSTLIRVQWRYDMVTISASLSLCKGKHGLPLGPLTHSGPGKQIFGVFFFWQLEQAVENDQAICDLRRHDVGHHVQS